MVTNNTISVPVAPTVVDRPAWLAARAALLAEEKELTRLRDDLAARRRALPWVRIDRTYRFETLDGTRSLTDLFDGRSQLIVNHFMMGPDWTEGCPSCSFWADNYEGLTPHLAARDVSLVTIARAPIAAISAYADRMGWHDLRFASSLGSEFNVDFGVSFPPEHEGPHSYNYAPLPDPVPMEEWQGISVFVKTDDEIFHTYSTYARGMDIFNSAYHLLDITPKGRDEDHLPYGMAWLRRHDEYATA